MDLTLLRTRLLSVHHARPQSVRRIEMAVVAVREGLETLAALGHPMHLAEGPAPSADEMDSWPRVYYHQDAAPNGRLVLSPWELGELGFGWYPTAAEAAHADGLATQFAGRGGVGRRDVPMVIPDETNRGESSEQVRTRLIAEFKQRRTGHNGL